MDYPKSTLKTRIDKYKNATNGNYQLYLLPCKILLRWRDESVLKNWSKNRMPEATRIAEIQRYQKKIQHVNGTIHLAWLKDEGLVCYDGNHRLQALTRDVNWVTVDINWNCSKQEIREQFRSINSAENVSVHILSADEDTENDSLKTIEIFVDKLCRTYPELIRASSGSGLPNRPYFTRTDLFDRIKLVCDKLQAEAHSLDQILNSILYLNNAYVKNERAVPCPVSDKTWRKRDKQDSCSIV
jgi:hypothetical protein